jgi:hypothetical protein
VAAHSEWNAVLPADSDRSTAGLSVELAVLMAATVAARRNGMHIQWVWGHSGKAATVVGAVLVTESVIPLARLGLSRPASFDPKVRQ